MEYNEYFKNLVNWIIDQKEIALYLPLKIDGFDPSWEQFGDLKVKNDSIVLTKKGKEKFYSIFSASFFAEIIHKWKEICDAVGIKYDKKYRTEIHFNYLKSVFQDRIHPNELFELLDIMLKEKYLSYGKFKYSILKDRISEISDILKKADLQEKKKDQEIKSVELSTENKVSQSEKIVDSINEKDPPKSENTANNVIDNINKSVEKAKDAMYSPDNLEIKNSVVNKEIDNIVNNVIKEGEEKNRTDQKSPNIQFFDVNQLICNNTDLEGIFLKISINDLITIKRMTAMTRALLRDPSFPKEIEKITPTFLGEVISGVMKLNGESADMKIERAGKILVALDDLIKQDRQKATKLVGYLNREEPNIFELVKLFSRQYKNSNITEDFLTSSDIDIELKVQKYNEKKDSDIAKFITEGNVITIDSHKKSSDQIKSEIVKEEKKDIAGDKPIPKEEKKEVKEDIVTSNFKQWSVEFDKKPEANPKELIEEKNLADKEVKTEITHSKNNAVELLDPKIIKGSRTSRIIDDRIEKLRSAGDKLSMKYIDVETSISDLKKIYGKNILPDIGVYNLIAILLFINNSKPTKKEVNYYIGLTEEKFKECLEIVKKELGKT